jgi:uncharacterized protein (TIGR00369 family)
VAHVNENGTIRLADLPADAREAVRAGFRNNTPLHELLCLEPVEIGERHAVLSMPVGPPAFNGTGNLHGGAIATLIDLAAGTAAARGTGFAPGEQSLVTADLHVRYLGRPRGEMVYARAEVVKAGRRLVIVDCRVTDGEDNAIAVADFSMMVIPNRPPLRPASSRQVSGGAHDGASRRAGPARPGREPRSPS